MHPGLACIFMVIFFRDGDALQFEAQPHKFMAAAIGLNLHINCTTNDPQATVKLFRDSKELVVTPNKVSKSGQTFTVINIGLSDAGLYSCKASNGNETIQWPSGYGMLFIVPDFVPPIRVEPGDAQVILTGESIDLTCYSEGALSTTLTWYKAVNNVYGKVPDNMVTFSSNVAMNEVKSVLSIKDAKQSDGAAYRCTLSHSGKQKSAHGNIIVRDPEPPSIWPYTGNRNVKEPSEKVLLCTAQGLPTPKVTWYKDGKVINITSCGNNAGEKECSNEVYSTKEFSTKLYATSELTIKETKYSRDHGTYTCVAVNKQGTDTLTIELNVQVAATLIKEKNIFTANYDAATNVSCQVDVNATNPLPEFEWFFQKIPQKCLEVQDCSPKESSWQALPNQHQKVHPASGQTQTSVVTLPKDQGPTFYFCRAKNFLGNDSNLIKFFRKEKAKPVYIDSDKQPVQYDEEGTLKLSCVDECGPFCSVHWRRNGIELSSNTDQRVNVTTSKTDFETRLVLIITGLHVNDSGNYTCQSPDGTYQDSISVNVKYGDALQFEAQPQQFMTTAIGLNLHINCTTNDPQATVKLFRGSKELVVTPNKVSKSGQTFTVINIGLSDAGFYSCKASKVHQTIQWPSGYGMLFIVPDFVPPIRVEPGDAQVILTGESIDLTCYSEGALSTTLTWYKEVNNVYGKVPDNMVTFSSNVVTNEVKLVLSIKDAKQSDGAAYRCTLSHSGKQKSAYGYIIVRDPEPPSIWPYTGNRTVTEPQEKVLLCTARGLPTPEVTWYKDGRVINITSCGDKLGNKECSNGVYSTKEFSTKVYAASELTIKETKHSRDQGTYTCVAVNKEGTDTLTIQLNVEVYAVAQELERPETTEYVRRGRRAVSLKCRVKRSNPLPQFTWKFRLGTGKRGKWLPLPRLVQRGIWREGHLISVLKISPKTRLPPKGVSFRCEARNGEGKATEEFKVYQI